LEIKIGLLASGAILLDGQPVDTTQLNVRLSEADRSKDQVLYYKEGLTEVNSKQSETIVKLVIEHKLPISFSTKPDFSDYVDRFGQSHPRLGALAQPPDRYAPFMPDVNLRRNAEEAFAEAHIALSKIADGRGIVFVGVDRAVMVIPALPRSPEMDARLPKVPDIPSEPLRKIAVIANTAIISTTSGKPPDLREAAKAIPFLGLLMGLGYAGHHIWIFEGHPSALAAGLLHAEILLLDSGMLPFLQGDWMSVAQHVMDTPRRVLIHSREHYTLLPAIPAPTPQGWTYSEGHGSQ
jgi:hypothetical protein